MRLLRALAIAIAVAAAIDPAITVNTTSRPRISVIEPAGSRVGDRFRDRYDVVRGLDQAAAAVIVVGDRYPSLRIPAGARVSTVTLSDDERVRIAAVHAPKTVPPATAIHLEADVDADQSRGTETVLVARTNGIEVARARHTWTGDRERWRAALDVIPVGEPPFVVTLAPDGSPAPTSVVVDLAPPLRVLFFEPRPSWPTTFVRRALERDPRFVVTTTTRLIGLDAESVVVGGLDRVTDADVAVLDRFARERGGAVALVPDARFDGAARTLLPSVDWRETLLEKPSAVTAWAPMPRLEASEILTVSDTRQRPVIWTAPRGDGLVLVSGALDAWRFRAAPNAEFDRFWRAAIGAVTMDVPSLVNVSVTGTHVEARVREPLASARDLAVSATLASGDPIRLWPNAEIGSFFGDVTLHPRRIRDRVVVTATADQRSVRGSAPLVDAKSAVSGEFLPLPLVAESHGGINVSQGNAGELDAWLRTVAAAPRVQTVLHPMRSIWWIVPFAACLSAEWWLRRARRRVR